MNISLGKGGEVKIILAFKDKERVDYAEELYTYLKEREIFEGNSGQVFAHISPKEERVLFLGLGEEDKVSLESLRKAFFNAGRELMKLKVESIDITIPEFKGLDYLDAVQAIAEGLLQSEYSFEKYLSEKRTITSIKDVYIDVIDGKEEESTKAIEEVQNIIEGVFLARNLINEPNMTMTPEILANKAKEELEEVGVKVDILNKEEIEKLGMNALLAVSQGSIEEPRLIVMTYEGDPESKENIVFVGKGLMFDSGGYCLKPAKGMDAMHGDMAGAAAVIGAIKSIAKSGLKKNVIGIVAACENLISGKAYKPGDIIKSMSGKTIEVTNTDCEGRLVLADALWYAANNIKADKIIDIATLTGACLVALGDITSGAITNDEELMKHVKKASERAGEPIWQLPNSDEYKELNKGTFADLTNQGKGAGAITAGLFLGEFVKDTPWVHLDIAGTSYLSSPRGYLPKGATGVHTKTLYYLVKNLEG
ncbi:MAG: leucyl aminopeptidase [Tissierellia bacterium]|nr:leucyl aminopeptidase [Tissierellia bacterium]